MKPTIAGIFLAIGLLSIVTNLPHDAHRILAGAGFCIACLVMLFWELKEQVSRPDMRIDAEPLPKTGDRVLPDYAPMPAKLWEEWYRDAHQLREQQRMARED